MERVLRLKSLLNKASLFAAASLMLLTSGCDGADLPGLRVLQGEGDTETLADQAVVANELVMADKNGSTNPALTAAADRIESANPNIDVIEIRQDEGSRIFAVNMLLQLPAQGETAQSQAAFLETLRRAFEVTWQGTMRASQDSDLLRVTLLDPQSIPTLDNGTSFIGVVLRESEIERSTAQAYLAGERSLNTFLDLITTGTLTYDRPLEPTLYEGTPNHPLFMLPQMGM